MFIHKCLAAKNASVAQLSTETLWITPVFRDVNVPFRTVTRRVASLERKDRYLQSRLIICIGQLVLVSMVA